MSFERRWRLADVSDLRILLDSSRLVQGNGYFALDSGSPPKNWSTSCCSFMIRNSGLGHFPVCFSSRDTYYSNVDVVEDTRRSTSFTTIARNHHYHKRDSCCPAFRHTAILLSTLVVRIKQLVCVCVPGQLWTEWSFIPIYSACWLSGHYLG